MELEENVEKLNPNYKEEENEVVFLSRELKKEKKVIDEMIQWISDRCLYVDDYINSCDVIQDSCYEWQCGKDCRQCIKQYFEKKVGESKQMINNIKDIEQICKQIDELSFEELQNAMEKADAELQKEEGE